MRPCFKSYAKVLIGDSTLRSFGRTKKAYEKVSITGFGGMDLLELCNILRSGKLSAENDLDKYPVRQRFQNGRDEFAKVRFCKHCRTECMEEFDGDVFIFIGLNNALKADRSPFADFKRDNAQDIKEMFKLLDKIVAEMLPFANVTFMHPLKVSLQKFWHGPPVHKLVFAQVNEEITKRKHIKYDTEAPFNQNLFDFGGVHMHDADSVRFWEPILGLKRTY